MDQKQTNRKCPQSRSLLTIIRPLGEREDYNEPTQKREYVHRPGTSK